MRKPLLFAAALLCAVGVCQTWTDHKGLTATFKSLKALTSRNANRHFSMLGDVTINSVPQGLNIQSDSMDIDAIPDSKNPKSYLVHKATAVGNVAFVKQVKSASGMQATCITGLRAAYVSGEKESVLQMAGPVSLTSTDSQKQPTLAASGNSSVAYFEPGKSTQMEDGLHRAQLDGNVHMTLNQRDAQTKKLTVIRTLSDHVLVENVGKGRKITLRGHVKIQTDAEVELNGIEMAVLDIDPSGAYSLHTSEAP